MLKLAPQPPASPASSSGVASAALAIAFQNTPVPRTAAANNPMATMKMSPVTFVTSLEYARLTSSTV